LPARCASLLTFVICAAEVRVSMGLQLANSSWQLAKSFWLLAFSS
jgi:hypothetical protein